MSARLLIAAGFLALAAGAAAAHESGGVAGQPGDPAKPARAVEVRIREAGGRMLFAPDRVEVRAGEQIDFVIVNEGALAHEFVIGTHAGNAAHAAMMREMPDMKHKDGNAVSVAPGASAHLLWRFAKRGAFEFACLVPGHYELGMRGALIAR